MLQTIFKSFRDKQILGINQRNVDFILKYNQRKFYPLVDDKMKTKSLAMEAGIAVPELLSVISIERQLVDLQKQLHHHEDFVIKPAHGAGGDGVLVVIGKHDERYRLSNQMLTSFEDLSHHISNILSGIYSLGGHRDKAMIEYRVKFSPIFENITYQGVPDIRIIVLLGYPAMAMVRLPTRYSAGKANLHQGAVGVGIDIATGKTLEGVWFNEQVSVHPDTGNSVGGLYIPHWRKCLELASKCYDLTSLGYLGIDIILDKDKGPLILEMNARPGLNIQIANDQGLLDRLQKIEQQPKNQALKDRIIFSQSEFQV